MKTYSKTKKRTWEIVSVANPDDRASRAFDIAIVATIAVSMGALVLQTVESIYQAVPKLFEVIEMISVVIFTIEYALRIWSCTADEKYASSIKGRLRFAVTPLALIDIIAILPFYMPTIGIDLRSIRAVWLFRLFRILKLGRYSVTLATFRRVITSKKTELITSLWLLFTLLFVASSLMYFAEKNGEHSEQFASIPEAFWWAIVTISTIGYGDVYPVTELGRFITAAVAIVGIGIAAIPTGIIVSAFWEEHNSRQETEDDMSVCSHCGKPCTHCVKDTP